MQALTSSSIHLDDGRIAHVYRVLNRNLRVIDGFEIGLLVSDLFEDALFDTNEKQAILLQMIFPDPSGFLSAFNGNQEEALSDTLWQAFGIDVSGDKPHEKPIIEWEQDAERIKATMLMAYGLDWEEARSRISYRDMCSLLGQAPHETPMGQALYYRTAKQPKATKHNREQIADFNRAKKHYAIREKNIYAPSANDDACVMFEAIARIAERG
ncbi:MAG: Gp15 family bacteriophage protein [Gordonibacter sp.]|uniref:Gp15 family bacteriophage protein n=1 Tax=Gordonibacter sp. TaxID=1968902 RepID=UPI002FC6C687